jgi:tetratricopeptide (TPR) repeat protein
MDRIAMLEAFVDRAPDDPFPRYGLALELAGRGRRDEALAVFAELARRHPAYLPTYLMYGNQLAAAGLDEQARAIYRRGIEVAGEQRDGKTAAELEAALVAVDG